MSNVEYCVPSLLSVNRIMGFTSHIQTYCYCNSLDFYDTSDIDILIFFYLCIYVFILFLLMTSAALQRQYNKAYAVLTSIRNIRTHTYTHVHSLTYTAVAYSHGCTHGYSHTLSKPGIACLFEVNTGTNLNFLGFTS